jgi:hypothetical protein
LEDFKNGKTRIQWIRASEQTSCPVRRVFWFVIIHTFQRIVAASNVAQAFFVYRIANH